MEGLPGGTGCLALCRRAARGDQLQKGAGTAPNKGAGSAPRGAAAPKGAGTAPKSFNQECS